MPVLEIGLAAAAAVATASYLMPLIISCIGGAIIAICTFFAGFSLARRKNDTDLSELRRQQYERDKQTKEEAEQYVRQTDEDVRDILAQSKRQQTKLDRTILAFQEEIDASMEATESLEDVTHDLRDIANTGQNNLTHMCFELDRLNTELVRVTNALKLSEQSLNEKEALLKSTLDKLTSSEQKASRDALLSVQHIQKLRADINHVHIEFETLRKTTLRQKEQMETLQEQNHRFIVTIEKLEKTTVDLSASLENAAAKNDSHFQEIQLLITENKRLVDLIEELSQAIESESESDSIEIKSDSYQTSRSSMRLFS